MALRVKITGLKHLRRLAAATKNPRAALSKASEIGAETTLNLISQGFKAGSDPYGKSWKAPNNLQITGGIKRYAKSDVGARGWKVHSTDEKAIWHHAPRPRDAWGGKALPTRLQIPTSGRDLPTKWRKNISRAFGDALVHLLKK